MARYYFIGCNALWREISHFAALSPHTFTLNFLETQCCSPAMRRQIQAAIDAVEGHYDAILLGYDFREKIPWRTSR